MRLEGWSLFLQDKKSRPSTLKVVAAFGIGAVLALEDLLLDLAVELDLRLEAVEGDLALGEDGPYDFGDKRQLVPATHWQLAKQNRSYPPKRRSVKQNRRRPVGKPTLSKNSGGEANARKRGSQKENN